MEVRYTDVDYLVFSDAASLMTSGRSPYERLTYRYSSLIAFLLLPNSIIHPPWGKFLFSVADLLVGLLVHAILKLLGVPEKLCPYSTIVWLFTPFTFTLGTRGNCEPIVCAMILWIIVCLMNGNMCQATLWYGLVVYLRICPIIYALPIILLLDPLYFGSGKKTQPYSLGSWESPVSPEFIQHQRYQAVHYDKNIYLYENYIWVDFWSCILLLLDGILFLLTLAFVVFNKVMTAQYFVWFFCILPLILPWSNMKL